MKNHLEKIKNKVVSQFLYIVVFATVFTVLGYYIPRFYQLYIDKTIYYRLDLPATTDKLTYKPCELVTVSVDREATIDLFVTVHTELTTRRENKLERVFISNTEYTILKGKEIVTAVYELPCTLEPGEYSFIGTVSYTINGVERELNYYSNDFTVL